MSRASIRTGRADGSKIPWSRLRASGPTAPMWPNGAFRTSTLRPSGRWGLPARAWSSPARIPVFAGPISPSRTTIAAGTARPPITTTTCTTRSIAAVDPAGPTRRFPATTIVVAGNRRVGPAGSTAAMDRVVQVVVVIGGRAVPAAIVVLEGEMGPANTGILAGDDHALAGKPHRPDGRSVDVLNAPFGHIGAVGPDARRRDHGIFDPSARPVRIDARDIAAGREQLDQPSVGGRDQQIGRPI